MQRVTRTTAVASMPAAPASPGLPGFFTSGNPGAGQQATVPGYEWFNGVQEELVGLLTRAGVTPSQADLTQLRQSLDRLYGGGLSVLSANATLTVDDAGLVLVNASGGARTITLPAANALGGRPIRYQIQKTDSTANTITVQRAGTDTIEGVASVVLSLQWSNVVLVSDGVSAWVALRAATGTYRQVFSASGTFVVPPGVTRVRVQVWGGGGGGGGAANSANGFAGTGGGGGGYADRRRIDVTPGQSIPVTIGAGGSAGPAGGSGGAGGSSSFGAFCSATGGAGGAHQSPSGTTQTTPGTGTGGDLNITGQPGMQVLPNGSTAYGGQGGGAPRGGLGSSMSIGSAGAGSAPGGGGGGGGGSGSAPGAAGAPGLVIVEWEI
jgi:hypothetical protein